jgi:hypothetical protein
VTETVYVEGSGSSGDVKLDTWLRDLLPRTPGALRKVVKREVVLAAREFFEQTAAWRVVVGPKNLVANKKRYYMSPYDAYANVVQVFSVELNGSPLVPLLRRPAGAEPTRDYPSRFYMDSPDTVRLWPYPQNSMTNALTFYVALAPKQTVTHLPAVALSHWYDAILDGALGRLFTHPAKPYSNPAAAEYHLKRFRSAIGRVSGQAKASAAGASSWAFPKFGK